MDWGGNGLRLLICDTIRTKNAQTEVLQRVLQFYAGGVLMRAKGYDRPDSTCELLRLGVVGVWFGGWEWGLCVCVLFRGSCSRTCVSQIQSNAHTTNRPISS